MRGPNVWTVATDRQQAAATTGPAAGASQAVASFFCPCALVQGIERQGRHGANRRLAAAGFRQRQSKKRVGVVVAGRGQNKLRRASWVGRRANQKPWAQAARRHAVRFCLDTHGSSARDATPLQKGVGRCVL